MSPALFSKYLDAAKRLAKHAILLPDGLRFSAATTRQDWTNEVLAEIRALYGAYSDSTASTQVKLQGLVWDTKQGGRLPVEKYLEATLVHRAAIETGRTSIVAVAKERGLSARYLELVWQSLTGREPSVLLDGLRARWRNAGPRDATGLAVEISRWQNAALEIQQRWTYRQGGRTKSMDGAGRAPGVQCSDACQGSCCQRRRRDAFPRYRAGRRRRRRLRHLAATEVRGARSARAVAQGRARWHTRRSHYGPRCLPTQPSTSMQPTRQSHRRVRSISPPWRRNTPWIRRHCGFG